MKKSKDLAVKKIRSKLKWRYKKEKEKTKKILQISNEPIEEKFSDEEEKTESEEDDISLQTDQ